MTGITEWLANLPYTAVLAIIAVLFLARLWLARINTPVAKSSAEMVESFMIAVVLVFLIIRPFIIQAFYIPSGSMLPTLEVRDHILVNKFIYRFREPQYGDIVVFKAPPEASIEQKDFIKRLIGRPGDVIEVKDGAVYRNGVRLEEPYENEEPTYTYGPKRIPKGHLFVMGDNRNDSDDSHLWGFLDRNRVIGKAVVRFFPLNRMGTLH